MTSLAAAVAIIAVFAFAWSLRMVGDPKRWRRWWMRHLGMPDVENTSAERRQQERFLRRSAALFSVLCVIVGALCISFVMGRMTSVKRVKTVEERNAAEIRRLVNGM